MGKKTSTLSTKIPSPVFPVFKKLSPTIFLYEPSVHEDNGHLSTPKPPSSKTTRPPHTILLLGWADGSPRNISKYVDGYKTLYPTSRIIVVLSKTLSLFINTRAGIQKSNHPVVLALPHPPSQSNTKPNGPTANGSPPQPVPDQPKVLIHAFSNGGGINLVHLSRLYHSIYRIFLPHSLLVLDSAPGGHRYISERSRWALVMTNALASVLPLPRFMLNALASIWVFFSLGMAEVFGLENEAKFCRRCLNDPALFQGGNGRLYVYSESDEVIGWEAVEEHAADAKGKGWKVSCEKYTDSAHVSHMRANPGKYWGDVAAAWDEAVRGRK
jgi:hypothetical protein